MKKTLNIEKTFGFVLFSGFIIKQIGGWGSGISQVAKDVRTDWALSKKLTRNF